MRQPQTARRWERREAKRQATQADLRRKLSDPAMCRAQGSLHALGRRKGGAPWPTGAIIGLLDAAGRAWRRLRRARPAGP